MSISIIGKDGSALATTSNGLPVFTGDATSAPNGVGAVRFVSENDNGSITGTAYLKSPETSSDYRLRVGMDTVLFNDTFNATAQNTQNWYYAFSTMTASQPGGYLQFGTVQGTASPHGAYMRSFQYFPVIGTAPIAVEFSGGPYIAALVPNEAFYAGLGSPGAAGTAPTDGAWFKMTNAGLFGELQYNGGSVAQVTLSNSQLSLGVNSRFVLVVGEENVEFWIDNILYGQLAVPTGQGQPFMQASLPVFMQKLCSGVVANTNTIRITDICVTLMDIQAAKPWPHQCAGQSKHALYGQNGHTQGQTTLWANNAAPTAVALTNTVAAFTGLGGIVAVLPTLAANTDGKLLTYQNPAPTINITGRNLYITRVTLKGAVSVVLAGGPVIYAYALAVGHTATSLATANTASFATATAHAPRFMPLGIESYAATAAVGTLGTGVDLNFETPIVVRPGEFVDIVARNIGTVTTTGAITAVISIGGYWE